MKLRKKILYLIMLTMVFLLAGCSLKKDPSIQKDNVEMNEPTTNQDSEESYLVPGPNSYDSADTAVVVKKNTKDSTITFLNVDVGKQYTLSIDGTTTLYDKYGEALSLAQIVPGDVVDITFLKNKKRLNSMNLSKEAWVNAGISRYEINLVRNDVLIGNDTYKLTQDTLYISDGKLIDVLEINKGDLLTFKGIGSSVLSVTVEKGHGFLSLKNQDKFVGGFIEIGQNHIYKIEKEMLLTVPEGDYDVVISHSRGGGKKQVRIERNKESVLDIGDLKIEDVKKGMIIFSVSPTSAKLYVDGALVDHSLPIMLDYGIHQMVAKAENYQTVTSYLKVGSESAGVDIVLEAFSERAEDEEDEEAYTVFIDSPTDAEVYLDGNYIGLAPVSFPKVEGEHVITLRKTGCITKGYTITIGDEKKDISYSFADLEPLAEIQ